MKNFSFLFWKLVIISKFEYYRPRQKIAIFWCQTCYAKFLHSPFNFVSFCFACLSNKSCEMLHSSMLIFMMKIIHPQCYLCKTRKRKKKKKKIKLVLFDEKLSFWWNFLRAYVRTWMFLMLIEVSWIVVFDENLLRFLVWNFVYCGWIIDNKLQVCRN